MNTEERMNLNLTFDIQYLKFDINNVREFRIMNDEHRRTNEFKLDI